MKIIIKDESSAHALIYILIWLVVLNLFPILGIKSFGFSTNYFISIVVIILFDFAVIYSWFKYKKYVTIDSSKISMHTRGILKNEDRVVWEFYYRDFQQIHLKTEKVRLGRNKRVDGLVFSFYRNNSLIEKKTIVSYLSYEQKRKIQELNLELKKQNGKIDLVLDF